MKLKTDSSVKAPSARSSRLTIQRIIQAAAEEIAEHGSSGAQMTRIAERASVSTQLLYHYFGSKEEMHIAVLEDIATVTMKEHLQVDYVSMDPETAIKAFLDRTFIVLENNPLIGPLSLSENISGGSHVSSRSKFRRDMPILNQRLNEVLNRGARLGIFRADVDAPMFFAACLMLCEGCFVTGNVMSVFLGTDLTRPDGRARWREFMIGMVLGYLRPGGALPGEIAQSSDKWSGSYDPSGLQ
jgi:AcrR family transcriptional regulator